MTSNAEEQATTQPVAPAQPPKATKRVTVPPRARRVEPSKLRSGNRATSGKGRPKSQKVAKQANVSAGARHGSKAAKVLDLLRRPDGASLKELKKATGWLAHSVRGFLSGTITKRMGLKLVSAKNKDGERRYSVKG